MFSELFIHSVRQVTKFPKNVFCLTTNQPIIRAKAPRSIISGGIIRPQHEKHFKVCSDIMHRRAVYFFKPQLPNGLDEPQLKKSGFYQISVRFTKVMRCNPCFTCSTCTLVQACLDNNTSDLSFS